MAYPSVLLVLGSNLLLLFFVLPGHWDVFTLLLVYWAEGVIMGILALAKASSLQSNATRTVSNFITTFDTSWLVFAFASSILAAADLFLISILSLSFDGTILSLSQLFNASLADVGDWLRGIFTRGSVWLAITLLMITHFVSFGANYLGRREYTHAHAILFPAFIRIGAPQLMAMMMALVIVGNSAIPLWTVVALKTLADLALHVIERMLGNPGPRNVQFEP